MKILIAVPTYENIMPDTFKSIYDLDKCGHDCTFEFVRGYDVASARNMIATRSTELEVDYVFMVDNDVVLPKDALKNLLEDPEMVKLGVYMHRPKTGDEDGRTIVFKDDEETWFHQYTADEILALEPGKIRIHGGGMGCALIHTDVFRKLRFPYFYWVHFCHDKKKVLSEDLYFCEQCRGMQIPIYMDTRVKCGHTIRYVKNIE